MAVTLWDHTIPANVTRYKGAVVGTFEQNLAHDSYFHAVVWDGEALTSVEYGATAYATPGHAQIDATPDVQAAAHAWAAQAAATHIRAKHATTITTGARVRSLTTRGKAKGLTGRVDRITDSRHHHGKVALVIDDATGHQAWVATDRLEAADPISDDEVTERAERMVTGRGPAGIYRMLVWGR